MPDTAPSGPTGVMLTRGTWKAWEPCDRDGADQAVAVLQQRHPDWWKPGSTGKAATLLIQFGHDQAGKFVPVATLDTVKIPGDD